jgi:hypothetical protein
LFHAHVPQGFQLNEEDNEIRTVLYDSSLEKDGASERKVVVVRIDDATIREV